jgi:hypothetical protein
MTGQLVALERKRPVAKIGKVFSTMAVVSLDVFTSPSVGFSID